MNAFIRCKKFHVIWTHRYGHDLILHYFYLDTHQSFKNPYLYQHFPRWDLCIHLKFASQWFLPWLALSWHSGLCLTVTSSGKLSTTSRLHEFHHSSHPYAALSLFIAHTTTFILCCYLFNCLSTFLDQNVSPRKRLCLCCLLYHSESN